MRLVPELVDGRLSVIFVHEKEYILQFFFTDARLLMIFLEFVSLTGQRRRT